jgi:hypothetical protein
MKGGEASASPFPMVKITLKNGRKVKVTETQARALRAIGYALPKEAAEVAAAEVAPTEVVPDPVVPVKRVYRRRVAAPAVTAVVTPEE